MKRLSVLFLGFIFCFSTYAAYAQTTASGETESAMGFARAVEVNNGSLFFGEPANVHQPGLVYIFGQSDNGWTQQGQLSASDGVIGDGFGSALTADGDQLLVGAPERNEERGAAYLFRRGSDGSWSQSASIAISDTSIKEGELGASVALSGNTAFIGAPGEQEGVGAVYVYKRTNAGSWSQQARLANPDTAQGLSFGHALAADGNRLVVGAPQKQGGAVYVFRDNGSGSWAVDDTLASDIVNEDAAFGANIDLRNNQVIVGAPRHAGGSGAVFVYQREENAEKWTSSGQLVAYDGGPRYQFGSSLSFVGSDVWVGAPGADNGSGALYQFKRSEDGTSWASVSKVNGPERSEGDEFASTLDVGENLAVAGLVGADYGAGKAAILERDDAGNWTAKTTVFGESKAVLQPITGNAMDCSNGKVEHFGCNNVDLLSFLPISEIGGGRGVGLNDIWGWTDPQTGKEYALVGRINGTSFVDVSDPQNPVYVANLPMTKGSNTSVWRDIKVYKNHAYVVADNAGEHGMQVVDLTKLRDYNGEPLQLEMDALYDKVHSVHNVVINEESGFAYAVGSSGGGQTCGGGLHMVNIQDPTNPTFAGCFADESTGRSGTGYTHDAQCVQYEGPDKQYQGQEICFGANETAISIADVSDKENPKAISTFSYPNHAYVHQGWLTEDQKYFISNDELDEIVGNVDQTRTLIWDVSDLDDPQLATEYNADNASSDHNLYIKDGIMYQSNYMSGLQVLDVSTPADPVKIGYFDTEPFGEDEPGFAGTWSNYPFFDSDIVIMTSSQEGLFILDPQNAKAKAASS